MMDILKKSMRVIQGYTLVARLFDIYKTQNIEFNLSKLIILYIRRLQLERMKGIYRVSCQKLRRNCQRVRLFI